MTRGAQNGYDKGGVATPLMSVTSPDSTLSIRIYTFLYSYISYSQSPSTFSAFHLSLESLLQDDSQMFPSKLEMGFDFFYLLLLAFVTASLPRRSPPSTLDWLSQPGQRHPIAKYHESYRTSVSFRKMAHHVIVGVLKKAPARARPTGRLSKKG